MPEAIKEVAPEKSPEKILAKEVKPAEASSGTLPADEQPLKNVEECAVAPEVGSDKPEEGKHESESSTTECDEAKKSENSLPKEENNTKSTDNIASDVAKIEDKEKKTNGSCASETDPGNELPDKAGDNAEATKETDENVIKETEKQDITKETECKEAEDKPAENVVKESSESLPEAKESETKSNTNSDEAKPMDSDSPTSAASGEASKLEAAEQSNEVLTKETVSSTTVLSVETSKAEPKRNDDTMETDTSVSATSNEVKQVETDSSAVAPNVDEIQAVKSEEAKTESSNENTVESHENENILALSNSMDVDNSDSKEPKKSDSTKEAVTEKNSDESEKNDTNEKGSIEEDGSEKLKVDSSKKDSNEKPGDKKSEVASGCSDGTTELPKEGTEKDNLKASEKEEEETKEVSYTEKQSSNEEDKKNDSERQDDSEMQVDNEVSPVEDKKEDATINNSSEGTHSVPENGKVEENEAGRSTVIDPKQVEEVGRLIREAKEQMAISEFFNAADLFGKACEIAGKLHGDLAKENAELYYSYGCAMLECAKNENVVLGEAVKENDEEEGGDENEDESQENGEQNEKDETAEKEEAGKAEVNGDEKMEVVEENEEVKDNVEEEDKDAEKVTPNGVDSEATVEGKENEEDEDSSLKTAWEMFELAKVIFTKSENNMKLSDTYIKLGEVGMESGHEESIEDMKRALELRLKFAAENDRLLAETHLYIGLAYGTFQKFDEAINSFQQSKAMIQGKIEKLKQHEQTKETEAEIKELTELLPDLDEKVQDMKDSKEAKEKGGQDTTNGDSSSDAVSGNSKPVSNISHLVKRKRKLEDVTSELLPNTKQACTEAASKSVDKSD